MNTNAIRIIGVLALTGVCLWLGLDRCGSALTQKVAAVSAQADQLRVTATAAAAHGAADATKAQVQQQAHRAARGRLLGDKGGRREDVAATEDGGAMKG